jgi:hypothetical protein
MEVLSFGWDVTPEFGMLMEVAKQRVPDPPFADIADNDQRKRPMTVDVGRR